jgi:hypothetical protein
MNPLTDSPEETIFKSLVREPKGYSYVERGNTFIEVTDSSGTYRVEAWKVVKRKAKNRPRGKSWKPNSLSDIL